MLAQVTCLQTPAVHSSQLTGVSVCDYQLWSMQGAAGGGWIVCSFGYLGALLPAQQQGCTTANTEKCARALAFKRMRSLGVSVVHVARQESAFMLQHNIQLEGMQQQPCQSKSRNAMSHVILPQRALQHHLTCFPPDAR
jgi:hypothetical protein